MVVVIVRAALAMILVIVEGAWLRGHGLILPERELLFDALGLLCVADFGLMGHLAYQKGKLTFEQMRGRFPKEKIAPLVLNPGLWSNDFLTTPLFAFIWAKYAGIWPAWEVGACFTLGFIVSTCVHRFMYANPEHIDPFVDEDGVLSSVAWLHHLYEIYAFTTLALLLFFTAVEPKVLLCASIILGLHTFAFLPGNVLWVAKKNGWTYDGEKIEAWAPDDIKPGFGPIIVVIVICGLDWYGNYQGAILGGWKVLVDIFHATRLILYVIF